MVDKTNVEKITTLSISMILISTGVGLIATNLIAGIVLAGLGVFLVSLREIRKQPPMPTQEVTTRQNATSS